MSVSPWFTSYIQIVNENTRLLGNLILGWGCRLTFNSTRLISIFKEKNASCRLLVPAIRSSEPFVGDRSKSGRESSHTSRSVRICLTFFEVSRDSLSWRPYTSGNNSPRISVNRHSAMWLCAALKRSVVCDPCGRRTSIVGSGTSY